MGVAKSREIKGNSVAGREKERKKKHDCILAVGERYNCALASSAEDK